MTGRDTDTRRATRKAPGPVRPEAPPRPRNGHGLPPKAVPRVPAGGAARVTAPPDADRRATAPDAAVAPDPAAAVGKAVLDRVGAAALLVVLAPVILVVALAVRCSGRGPVVYRQCRVGRGGEMFELLKFRTMVRGADAAAGQLEGCNEADGLLFKIQADPRITRVGRVLRRSSLDEVPQFWNVVRGEMSLVGPRPLPIEPEALVGRERRRLDVKPGITGLWQVSGRSELSWDETVVLDARYVDDWSLGLDLRILLRTPLAVVRGRGAW